MRVMKKLFLLAIAGWLLGPGCATRTVTEDQRAIVPPPEPRRAQVGMTREEIESIYGRPQSVFMRPNGETWHYDNRGMAWIPFNYGYRYRQSNFVFDQTGHLRTFRIDQ
jgi:outer membrane protein assembly factor BamE (lipoprotein component of BamABCDE complex)